MLKIGIIKRKSDKMILSLNSSSLFSLRSYSKQQPNKYYLCLNSE